MTLTVIVSAYVARIRPRAQAEIDWFAQQPTLRAAITNAAMAVNRRGMRYSHQQRLKSIALACALDALLKKSRAIERSRNFVELFKLVEAAVEPVPGLGQFYVYDTALGIGSNLNLFPEEVYLHATRQGARALGLDAPVETLSVKDLPPTSGRMKSKACCAFSNRRISVPSDAARRSWCG